MKLTIPGYYIDGYTFYITNNIEEFLAVHLKLIGYKFVGHGRDKELKLKEYNQPSIWKCKPLGFFTFGTVKYYKDNMNRSWYKTDEEYPIIKKLLRILDNNTLLGK